MSNFAHNYNDMPLTKDEIRSLLGDIENERVERTLSTDNTKKMSEAICAFANDIRNTKKPGYFMMAPMITVKSMGRRSPTNSFVLMRDSAIPGQYFHLLR